MWGRNFNTTQREPYKNMLKSLQVLFKHSQYRAWDKQRQGDWEAEKVPEQLLALGGLEEWEELG